MKLTKIIFREFGLDFKKTRRGLKGLPVYLRNYRAIKQQARNSEVKFPFDTAYPCLSDRYASSGVASGHYFHQDLLVAQKIFTAAPDKHVDVGSRVDGFVAHLASFRAVEVFDIRPLDARIENICFRQIDLMSIPDEIVNYTDSLSCLHAIEHLGLGRYGDTVDYNGYVKGFENLAKVLRVGGTLYFSTPISHRQRINFDAHRVFSMPTLIGLIEKQFRIHTFSYVDDAGDLHVDVDPTGRGAANSFACRFGCGIFELKKIVPVL